MPAPTHSVPEPPRFTLLTAARVVDGSSARALEDAACLMEEGRVVRVGPKRDVRAPAGAPVTTVDYGDATILPGLVDAHTHLVAPGDGTLGDDIAKEDDDILLLQAAQNARTLLHSGVTTIRENGAKDRVAFSLREGIRRGLAPGPRMVDLRPAHRDHRRAHGVLRLRGRRRGGRARGGPQAAQGGRRLHQDLATGGWTRTSDPNRASYTVAELRAITRRGAPPRQLTAAHCTSAQGVENCLDAEVDMIIHCIFNEPDGTYRYRPDLVERLIEARAWVNPTLYVVRAGVDRLSEKQARGSPDDRRRRRSSGPGVQSTSVSRRSDG